jgi:hypothetical protein
MTRPSLTDRFAKKALPPAAAPEPAPQPAQRDNRVQVLVRMSQAERKSLRRIALEQDTTVQAIVEDAIRDVLRRHVG